MAQRIEIRKFDDGRQEWTFSVIDFVRQTALFPRRLMRRSTCFLYDGDRRLPETGKIVVSTEPRLLRWRKVEFKAWLGHEPLMLLHKPVGYVVSSQPDGGHPSIFEVLPSVAWQWSLQPVGRLDVETSGLMLFTADGALLQRLTHPKRAVEREYLVGTVYPLSDDTLAQMGSGEVVLRDGLKPTPALVEDAGRADSGEYMTRVVLTEGKYHEVRRLFAALGHGVVSLKRQRFGSVGLDFAPELDTPGESHLATNAETAAVYASVGMKEPGLRLLIERLTPDGMDDEDDWDEDDDFEDDED